MVMMSKIKIVPFYTDEFFPIISPLLECTTRPSNSTDEFFIDPHGVFSGSFSSLLKNIINLDN